MNGRNVQKPSHWPLQSKLHCALISGWLSNSPSLHSILVCERDEFMIFRPSAQSLSTKHSRENITSSFFGPDSSSGQLATRRASWQPGSQESSARRPQPGVLSQDSSARSPQPGFLSQKTLSGILSQDSSPRNPQPAVSS